MVLFQLSKQLYQKDMTEEGWICLRMVQRMVEGHNKDIIHENQILAEMGIQGPADNPEKEQERDWVQEEIDEEMEEGLT